MAALLRHINCRNYYYYYYYHHQVLLLFSHSIFEKGRGNQNFRKVPNVMLKCCSGDPGDFSVRGILTVYIGLLGLHVAEQDHVVVLSAKYTVHLNHQMVYMEAVVTAGVVEHIFNA